MGSFIPSLHFRTQKEKLTREWANDVTQFYHFQNRTVGLLDGKDVANIDGYSDGDYDMTPYKKMYISFRKQLSKKGNPNYMQEDLKKLDQAQLNFDQVALIAPKLNSAIATIQKRPIEVKCICIDPLAQKRKKEDLDFLKNKSVMEEVLQPIYDSMNLGKVDLGATKYSSVPYNALPFGLDQNDEQEFLFFSNIIYNVAPETAYETILNYYTEYKKVIQIRGLETRDQYKYAISTNRVIMDGITELPDLEYIYPGSMRTDGSRLPDYSDNVYRELYLRVTPMELFKYFPDEICDEDMLQTIVNGKENGFNRGYCGCNEHGHVTSSNFDTFKMNLAYVEVKSVDRIMIGTKTTKRDKYQYFTTEQTECTDTVWGQNTYRFYWLVNTKWFFGIDKLSYAYRAKGKEKYQRFSTNIYKSQSRSAVELSIGENKKAQIADIKLQFELIMSLPTGRIIDMKAIRNAVQNQLDEEDKYTVDQIMEAGMERNTWLIDTEGLDKTKDSAQYKPVNEIPGGIKNSMDGYYRVIAEADAKIAQYTNIYPQLTGQSVNPEGLIGLEKLAINASMNGLYYVDEAIVNQYTPVYYLFANGIKQAIKSGGAGRKAVEGIIGTNKVEILDAMDDIPLHDVGMIIKLGQREEERAKFEFEIENMRKEGKIDGAAKYLILNQPNPKDQIITAAMFERKWEKKQDQIRQEMLASQQQIAKQQGENMMQNTQAKTQGDMQKIDKEGQVEGQLMILANKLGLTQQQFEALAKRTLQNDRMDGQINKALRTLYAKNNLEQQLPLPA